MFEWLRPGMYGRKTAARTGNRIGRRIADPIPAGKCAGWIALIRLPVTMGSRDATMHEWLKRSGLRGPSEWNVPKDLSARNGRSARSDRSAPGATKLHV
jgi:hypothetical protein